MYGISLALYIAGYLTTHSNKNLLTIVAVLGCLPASKSAVNMIMFIRAKGCSEDTYNKIIKKSADLCQRFDLYLTSYQKNFQISHIIMKGHTMVGLTEAMNFDEKACYSHLKDMFSKNGIKNVTVKIFSDVDKYLCRLEEITQSGIEEDNDFQEATLHLLENLSL